MTHQFRRLALAFVAAFALVALTAGYWAMARRDALLGRTDNPRRVLAERRIRRGAIYDRAGQVLAEARGEPGNFERFYPYPALAPVLGYVSAFYGSTGVEAAADGVLHGDAGRDPFELYWDEAVLAAPPPGRSVTLSIDLRLQQSADAQLGQHTGTVVLLNARTGEILALASHPTYDANTLDADWLKLVSDPGAPLLNRAAQALYQPGAALAPLILAAGLQVGAANLHEVYPLATEQVAVSESVRVGCRLKPLTATLTLAQALNYGCPAPFADLGRTLGAEALTRLFNDFRLLQPPPIPIPAASSSSAELASAPDLAAIGQSDVTVTPLHLALAAAALANDGRMPAPLLITAEQDTAGAWQPMDPISHPIAALPPEFAQEVKALLGGGYSAASVSSASGGSLAWFLGFAPIENSEYAIAVLLEDGDTAQARIIGRRVLQAALDHAR